MTGEQQFRTHPQLCELSDEEVVQRVLAGETELFEILMRRYNQRLYRVARGFVRDGAEAEDIAQEAYVSAYHRLTSFRGEALFSTWLTRIAVHEAMARVRKRRRFELIGDAVEDEGASESLNPERDVQNLELRQLLQAAVDSLPVSLRPIFVLRELEGLSTKETAAHLGIQPGNVRVRLHRAKTHLQRHVDRRLGQEARRLYLFDGRRCDRLVAAV